MEHQLDRLLTQVQKPVQYAGGELGSIIKDRDAVRIRFAFCFPDKYEVGMSHLGMKILYGLLNRREDTWCERVFAPDRDMEQLMRERSLPLYGLESRDPIRDFDFIGFTLQYELCYTNLLNMLDLAGLPVRACDRGNGLSAVVIAGGPCACNPEPLADFIDLFVIGEGEEVTLELMDCYLDAKGRGLTKRGFLREAQKIEGIYVPSLYDVAYNADGTIAAVTPQEGAPAVIRKRIVRDLDAVYYPEKFVVPFAETVHDRAMIEVMRGCCRGCRFCQAGFIYRPLREKTSAVLNDNARDLCAGTGYDELSLVSLSTSDYSEVEPLLDRLLDWSEEHMVSISLPSLRIDSFSGEMLERIKKVRKSGLTFAPEAGTQRMRDVINKNLSEEEILKTCETAFRGGYTLVKLYFMIGLPGETEEDIVGIAGLAQKIVDLYYQNPDKPKGKSVTVNVGVSGFVPKPHTPFEFVPQDSDDRLREKQRMLKAAVNSRKINLSFHDARVTRLEGIFARADRRVGPLLEEAWRQGCAFDSWTEHFRYDVWEAALEKCGIDPAFYTERERSYDEILPWDHIDHGVDKSFLIREHRRSLEGQASPNCKESCANCGADSFLEGKCPVALPEETEKIAPQKTPEDMDAAISEQQRLDLRLRFSKTGGAVYLSHLDLNRCIQRAVKRATLPVWYTEGFNPRLHLVFARPLSLGHSSRCELVDLRLTEPMDPAEVAKRLNASLPDGIRILGAWEPKRKLGEIEWAEYEIRMEFAQMPDDIITRWSRFMAQESIPVEKKTKRGSKILDLKPHMQGISLSVEGDTLVLTVRLSAGQETSVNPVLLVEAFVRQSGAEPEFAAYTRTALLDVEGKMFE